jgi:hypothetical protein
MENIQQEIPNYLPDFPANYVPEIVAIYDNKGLLIGMENGQLVYESTRDEDFIPSYVAWYFDEELGLFYSGGSILVNRINAMSAYQEIVNTVSA